MHPFGLCFCNVPSLLLKAWETARGSRADRACNIQLLKERSWFDVPLVYTNQRRAIIAIEKGAPGERAFNDAFAAWGD